MSAYAQSAAMKKTKGVRPGCNHDSPSLEWLSDGRRWVCTDHIVVDGVLLHVAGNATEACALWTDNKEHALTTMANWASSLSEFRKKFGDEVWTNVPEEEVEAAATALLGLLQSLETKESQT